MSIEDEDESNGEIFSQKQNHMKEEKLTKANYEF